MGTGGIIRAVRIGQMRAARRRAGAWLLVAGLTLAPILSAFAAEAQTRPRPRPDLNAQADVNAQAANSAAASQQGATRPAPRPEDQPQNTAPAAPTIAPNIGPVTKQPLPRFVSLKGSEGNARRGPGLTHRIDWVFTTKGTPLRVVAEYENWRKVEDFEGLGGWVHFALLSVARTVIITTDMAQFHTLPDPASPVAFQAERGVLARLLECQIDWCRVNADGERGWAPKSVIWGVRLDEVVE
jgi:SH3-like domain-containing protein